MPDDPFNKIPDIVQITERACERIRDCLTQRGQKAGGYSVADRNSWLSRRQLARTTYAGNLKHRILLGGVFGVPGANLSLRTSCRIIGLRAAKQAADLVGSEPFMAAMPARIEDDQMALLTKQAETKVQEEIARSNLRMTIAEGVRIALSQGECPTKITWESDVTEFPDSAEVAVDANGAPIQTPKGDYIYRKDDALPVVVNETGDFLRIAQTNPDGSPLEALAMGEAIELRLKKEPSFIFAEPPQYAPVEDLQQKLTHREGLHAANLFAEDFIYPLLTPSLDDPECDIMVHRYDASLESVAQHYENAGYVAEKANLQERTPQSQAAQPNDDTGEQSALSAGRKTISIHETYFRTWLRPKGQQPYEAWLFIVIDFEDSRPIYAQYLGRMRMKKPPFFLLRGLESEPGRAYGVGIFDRFEDRDKMIDVWFNRAALKSSRTSSLTCAHADGLEEIRDGDEISFGTDKVYRILSGSQYGVNNPPVFRINLEEMSDKEYELLEKMIQSGELEFGAVNAADGTGGEDSVNGGTATAIRNIERTGNVLNEASEALQASDIEKGLHIAVDAILENMDPEEMRYVPGENTLSTLNRDEIRNLDRDVRLLVTKARSADSVEIAQAAVMVIEKYYTYGPQMRRDVRDQLVEVLKGYSVQDADQKLRAPTDAEIAAEADGDNIEEAPLSVSISLSDLKNLAPSERAQILEKYYGVQGAPPEELQQMQAQEQAFEMEKASLKVVPKPGEGQSAA